jgi:hypothetical protein
MPCGPLTSTTQELTQEFLSLAGAQASLHHVLNAYKFGLAMKLWSAKLAE